MADRSAIEWTDATWNPLRARETRSGRIGWHCEHVSPGCEHCYAEGINKRLGTGLPFKPGHRKDIQVFLDEKMLTQPLRWKRPRTIFVNSMSDTFADFVRDEWIDRMFAVMALCPQHRFQVLTKRAKRMREYFSLWLAVHAPLPNVWLGVSAEDQANANARIPDLLATPAAVRFVSLEPLLGAIDLEHIPMSKPDDFTVFRTINALTGRRGHGGKFGYTETCDPIQPHLDWVIVGGESGPGARPMHPDWARSLRDQCQNAQVPFFMKQIGEWQADRLFGERAEPDGMRYMRVGKKRAGRLLDGIEHNGMPA